MTTYEGCAPQDLDPECTDELYELYTLIDELLRGNEGAKRFCLKGGNAQLPLAIAEKLQSPIHYGATLTAVHLHQGKPLLTFNNTQQIEADLVLLTIPCPIFQDIAFSHEALPPEQLAQILDVQYGTNAKILLPVKLRNKTCEYMLYVPHFMSLLNQDDTIMTFYSGGQDGILDKEKATALFQQGSTLLPECYGDIAIGDGPLEQATDIQLATYPGPVYKSWVKDPYAKGSYSTRGVGKVAALNEMISIEGEEVRKIFRPAHNRIFFAGEHTTTLPILGTMESAIESGERMVRIMGILSNSETPH
jgi:monoamine oxidase